jgi:FkbM family methyltransferase
VIALRRVWHLRRAWQLAAVVGCAPLGRLRVVGAAARLAGSDLAGRRAVHRLALGELGAIEVHDFSELLVLWEVFVAEVYDVSELPPNAALVLDVGCNVGASLLWFARRYPNARIVGYEADPATAALARKNTAQAPTVEVHSAALAAADGEITFWRIPGQSWGSGTFERRGVPVSVSAVALDTVLAAVDRPVDILKLNIEGAEHPVLAAARRLDRVETILGQYHPGGGVSWDTLRQALEGFAVRPAYAPDDKGRPFVAVRGPG